MPIRRDLACMLLLCVFTALAFAAPLSPSEQLSWGDHNLVYLPRWHAIVSAFQTGHLPARTPTTLGGLPVEQLLNGTYTLLSPIVLLGGIKMGYDVFVWAHVALTALGIFVLARQLGANRLAATLAGAGALFGPLISFENLLVSLIAVAYTPWVLWAFARILQQPSLGSIALLGLSAGCQLQGIMPEIVVLDVIGGGVILIAFPPRNLVRSSLYFLVGCILSFSVASLELFPALQALQGSHRAAGFPLAERSAWSLYPLRAIGFIFPGFFGLPDIPFASWVDELETTRHYLNSIYIGPSIVIAVLGIINAGTRLRLRVVLVLVLAFGVLMSLGIETPVYPTVSSLPVLSSGRYPIKYLLVAYMALIALLPIGLQLAREKPKYLLIGVFLYFLAASSSSIWVGLGGLDDTISSAIKPDTLLSWPNIDKAAAVKIVTDAQQVRITHSLSFIIMLILLVWVMYNKPSKEQFLTTSLVILLATDLALAANFSIPTVPASIKPPPELQDSLTGHRYLSFNKIAPRQVIDPTVSIHRQTRIDAILRTPALGTAINTHYYDADAQGGFGSLAGNAMVGAATGARKGTMLLRMGVTRVLSAKPLKRVPDITVAVPNAMTEKIFFLGTNRGHATAFSCWSLVGSSEDPHKIQDLFTDPVGQDIAVTFLPPGADPGVQIVCPDPPALVTPLKEKVTDSGNRVEINTFFDRKQLVVIMETHSIGWHTYIDGQEVETLEAEAGFVGAFVPAGPHHLRFIYEPLLQRWIPVSLVGFATCLVLLIIEAVQTIRSKSTETTLASEHTGEQGEEPPN